MITREEWADIRVEHLLNPEYFPDFNVTEFQPRRHRNKIIFDSSRAGWRGLPFETRATVIKGDTITSGPAVRTWWDPEHYRRVLIARAGMTKVERWEAARDFQGYIVSNALQRFGL